MVLSRSIQTLRAVLMCVRTHPIRLSFLADHTTHHPSQDASKIPVTSMGAIMNVASSGAQQIGPAFGPPFSRIQVSTRSGAYPYLVRARPPLRPSPGDSECQVLNNPELNSHLQSRISLNVPRVAPLGPYAGAKMRRTNANAAGALVWAATPAPTTNTLAC